MRKVLLLICAGLLLPACSEKQVYEGLRKRNEVSCYELPVAQQQDCLQQAREIDYEEYRQELKKAAE